MKLKTKNRPNDTIVKIWKIDHVLFYFEFEENLFFPFEVLYNAKKRFFSSNFGL